MALSGGFNFSRDFTKTGASAQFVDPRARLPVPHAQHVAAVEQARQEAYQAGLAEGRALQENAEQQLIGRALDTIAQVMPGLIAQMKTIEVRAQQEALAFTRDFAEKLAGRLVEQSPLSTIEATARAIMDDLRGSAHVAVRVAPSIVDSCKNRLTLLLRENGIEPKLFVFPDPDIAAGDCRIEWADGGIVRERAVLLHLIDKSLEMLLPKQN